MATTRAPTFAYKADDADGSGYLRSTLRGNALLRLAATNKGTAFSEQERRALGLEGMLPPQVCALEQQVARLYRWLLPADPTTSPSTSTCARCRSSSEVRFYSLLQQHLEEMMPIVYTPTVGARRCSSTAICTRRRAGSQSRRATSTTSTSILDDYPLTDVRMLVATDHRRSSASATRGHGGLAICIGKLALYTAGAGVVSRSTPCRSTSTSAPTGAN